MGNKSTGKAGKGDANVRVAEIRLLPTKSPTSPRPIGLAQDRGEPLPESFFEDLPKEVLSAFGGEGK